MNKIVVEVGSTCTKFDQYDGKMVERIKEITIFFKKNYTDNHKIISSDFELLVQEIKNIQSDYDSIYVCGTSIFRMLSLEEKEKFINQFKLATGLDFHVISQEKENTLTVLGATHFVTSRACIFVGGGGSTEISIYDGEILESVNTPIGVMDVMQVFPDLGNDFASTSLETVKRYIKERINLPKEKASVLILAGGGHEKFARLSGFSYTKNSLFQDPLEPIMISIDSRILDTQKFFEDISLDAIRKNSDDASWWYATRAMCAFVLVVAEEIGASVIIPTDIGMTYGILAKEK